AGARRGHGIRRRDRVRQRGPERRQPQVGETRTEEHIRQGLPGGDRRCVGDRGERGAGQEEAGDRAAVRPHWPSRAGRFSRRPPPGERRRRGATRTPATAARALWTIPGTAIITLPFGRRTWHDTAASGKLISCLAISMGRSVDKGGPER